jgi:eukaryotic-like serine/threonine-protein kinase
MEKSPLRRRRFKQRVKTMPPDPPNAETLFHQAVEMEPQEREPFLSRTCGNDPALRHRVEALLTAHDKAGGFLRRAPAGLAGSAPDEAVGAETIGTMIGRYKLLEKLGEGGFGSVWAAEQREPIRRRVALKIIKLGMDTKQVIARFEAERQALAMMDHPNIAKVLDAGATESGRLYFVMELVHGIPITNYCEEQQLDTKDRLDLFIKICHAIQHAHQKGIIHRDIKPSNILVTLHDGVPVPKVIDFGIAKATQAELTEKTIYTQFHQFIGTPAYMSPEQAEMSGLDIDTRSDIYSLGVLLYELLTGKTPFDGKALLRAGLDEMRRIIREQEPLRPSTRLKRETAAAPRHPDIVSTASGQPSHLSTFRPSLSTDLDWIVMKCLEKDRTRRYETANGLAADILRHLNDEPVLARPPSTAYRLQKAFRRNKLAFAATIAVAAALVAGLGISLWQASIANRARKDGLQSLYARNMNLAQQAWEKNNVELVRQLLEETATYPDRGFEWYFWQRQTHLELRTFRGHTDGVWSVAYSPDGRLIATGSSDHTAKIWNAATGLELHTLKGHHDWVGGIAFFPDGRRIVTGSSDQTARIWDVATGNELKILVGHTHWITSVAVSPDGQRIVTGSHDNTARIWDAASGKHLLTLKGHRIRVGPAISSVAFSPNGERIVTGSNDRTAQVWDAATGAELLRLEGHTNRIRSVAFSPDGKRIATGSADQTVRVWDPVSGKELFCLQGQSGLVTSLAFSPDNQRIVTGSADSMVRIWDARSGKELFRFKGHSDGISSVAFSPDGRMILSGSRGHVAKIWAVSNTREVLAIPAHTREITSIAFSPDGNRFVTASYDKTASIWDSATGKELFPPKAHSDEVWSVTFSHDGQRIVTGSADLTAKVWVVGNDHEPLVLTGHDGTITSVAFSPDDRRIVTGSYDHTARIWDATTGKELLRLNGHDNFIACVAFSPDSQRIATGSYDGTARVWDAITGHEIFKVEGRVAAITALHPAFGSGPFLTLKGQSAAIISVTFSPDGQRLITGSGDGTASVRDAADGKELLVLKGHKDKISSVSVSPDGRRIVTASHDQTIKLWDATSGKELLSLTGSSDSDVASVTFSLDGRRIASGNLDGTARLWLAATPQQVDEWQQDEAAAAARLQTTRCEEAVASERAIASRIRDPGMIKQWLVLAPIVFQGTNGAPVDEEQIPAEADLGPRAGEKIKIGETELVWKPVELEDYLLDFTRFLGAVHRYCVAYEVCYIQSDSDKDNLVMKVGSNEQSRVYLNGREIHRRMSGRAYVADQDAVAGVKLKSGLNVLVFKVMNQTPAWQGSIRFSDAADQPLKGIKVILNPD